MPDPEPWIRLSRQLWAWYGRWIDDDMRDEIQLRFRLKVTWHDDEQTFEQAFDRLVTEDPELYLDTIDVMLWICARRAEPQMLPGETPAQLVDENYVDYAGRPNSFRFS